MSGRRWVAAATTMTALIAFADVARSQPVAPAIVSTPAPAIGASGSHTVALLPLDADARLELYGQPVASELARALSAGALDVVIVGPKLAVPDRAVLVVDGTIKQGAPGAPQSIVLAVRVRNPRDGRVIEQVAATAATLSTIDTAAADLSARVLPVLRAQLALLDQAAARDRGTATTDVITPVTSVTPAVVRVVARPGVAIAVTGGPGSLRDALAPVAAAWITAASREPHPVSATALSGAAGTHLAVAVLAYAVATRDGIDLARARVHVVIAGEGVHRFDRVIRTDTVVGRRGESAASLATRVAGEVLAILDPHMRRAVAGWP